ncbi:J domain-containing protein [Rhodanobacter sp. BL-MT-08]
MSPFARLGLPADADERAIKRAYAQRLRQTRPEDDPAGFQELHAAYQAALDWCRQRALSELASVDDAAAPPAANDDPSVESTAVPAAISPAVDTSDARISAKAVSPPMPTFSMQAFCDEAITLATKGDADELQRWLGRHPALWSLQLKAQAGRLLVQQIYRQEPPMPAACLSTILRFFDLDHALAGHDPLALQMLQRRTQLAWELQPDHRGELIARLRMRDKPDRKKLERTLRQLALPFHWPQVLLSGLDVTRPRRIAETVGRLTGGMPDALPVSIRRDQLAFWLAAADRTRVSKPRLLLGLSRSVAGMFAMLLVGLLCGPVFSVYPDRFTAGPAFFLVGCAAAAGMAWALLMAWLPLENWHSRREELPARWPWLCLLLVPLLCAAGMLLTLSPFPSTSLLLILPATLLALRRYGRRQGGGKIFAVGRRFIWVTAVVLSQIVHALKESNVAADDIAFLPGVLAGVAVLIWSIDLWKSRRRLRVRSASKRLERQLT